LSETAFPKDTNNLYVNSTDFFKERIHVHY